MYFDNKIFPALQNFFDRLNRVLAVAMTQNYTTAQFDNTVVPLYMCLKLLNNGFARAIGPFLQNLNCLTTRIDYQKIMHNND